MKSSRIIKVYSIFILEGILLSLSLLLMRDKEKLKEFDSTKSRKEKSDIVMHRGILVKFVKDKSPLTAV